jgi:hypothetical protein
MGEAVGVGLALRREQWLGSDRGTAEGGFREEQKVLEGNFRLAATVGFGVGEAVGVAVHVQKTVIGFGVGAAVGFKVGAAVGCGTGVGLALRQEPWLGSDRRQRMVASAERNEKFLRETSDWLQLLASE